MPRWPPAEPPTVPASRRTWSRRRGARPSRRRRSTIGTQSYLLGAARLTEAPDGDPVLVLGRATKPIATATVHAPPLEQALRLPLAAAGGIALVGFGLLFSRRGKAGAAAGAPAGTTEPSVVPIIHETTLKFGEPREPRNDVHPDDAGGGTGAGSPPGAHTVVIVAPASDSSMMFGRYRLVERLSEGGMSELFIAKAAGIEGFTRSFVLKRLRPELARDKDAVAQFVDEARLQADLVHSNIVPVFDFGVVGGEYFMTQEYILGRDLGRVMERQRAVGRAGLPSPVAYFAAHETLQALAYAHARRDRRRHAAGNRSPGHRDGQHPRVARGRGEAVGLRHREVERPRQPDAGRRRQGQHELHVARAGARAGRRRAQRPVLARARPLLLPVRRDAVRREQRPGGPPPRRRRPAAGRLRAHPAAPRSRAPDPGAGAGAGPEPPLPDRRRVRRRGRRAHGRRPDRRRPAAARAVRPRICRPVRNRRSRPRRRSGTLPGRDRHPPAARKARRGSHRLPAPRRHRRPGRRDRRRRARARPQERIADAAGRTEPAVEGDRPRRRGRGARARQGRQHGAEGEDRKARTAS